MAELTLSQAISSTILAEMRRDPTIYTYSWGMPSKAMVDEFGPDRACYSGISEIQEAGAGIGAALAGMRPIVNLSMSDFAVDAWGQIVVQAAKVGFEGGYKTKCPVVFRISYGAWGGQSVMHSNCYHNWAANAPGLLVAVPSNAYDAVGLYRTALRTAEDPVCFFENTPAGGLKREVPDADYTIPFGVGAVQREGNDVTIAGVGYWVQAALDAAADLEKEGISAEVWDPRTLIPFDRAGLLASVQKTGALVVTDQAPKTFGTTAEFMATVAEAVDPVPPMARVATMDVPVGFAPTLESYMLPNKAKIIAAVKAVIARKVGPTLGGGK